MSLTDQLKHNLDLLETQVREIKERAALFGVSQIKLPYQYTIVSVPISGESQSQIKATEESIKKSKEEKDALLKDFENVINAFTNISSQL